MKKYFILNVVLNFALAFIVYSGYMAFQLGNQLILGLSIAFLVLLVYFKIVLLKLVKKQQAIEMQKATKKPTNKK